MGMKFGESMTERHVQAIWYDDALRPGNLFTRRGSEVKVIHPGTWNLGPGPDFKNAVLEIGPMRMRLKGDVEVHLNPDDWDRHGHGSNPAYENVIAHITWNCGPEAKTLPGRAVSIWIGRFLMHEAGFAPEMVDLSAYPFAKVPISFRPCYWQFKDNPEEALKILRAAGEYRLKVKAERMRKLKLLRSGDEPQLFYEEIMNAMGYRYNSRGFRRVARAVPIKSVLRESEVAAQAYLAAAEFVEWEGTECRPNNRPERRLRAAAEMFGRDGVMELMAARDFSREGCRKMVKQLKGRHNVGAERAAAILANVVAPFAGVVPEWLPPEGMNAVTRLTAYRLWGRDHNPAMYRKDGVLLQGLLQIHREMCLRYHPECERCGLRVES